jgi:hypothetical protein
VAFDGSIEVPKWSAWWPGMNLVPEKRELFGEMSVEDNLLLGAFQRHRSGLRDHPDDGRGLRPVPAPQGAPRSWPAPCRAASARCWRWAAR